MKKNIYDGKGKYIGYTNDIGTMIHAYDKNGKSIGLFNKAANYTYNSAGKPIAKGNLTEGMILIAAGAH